MLDGEWLSYPEAAKRLQISEDAIRQSVKADRMHERRGLDGRPVVWVSRRGTEGTKPGEAPAPTAGKGNGSSGSPFADSSVSGGGGNGQAGVVHHPVSTRPITDAIRPKSPETMVTPPLGNTAETAIDAQGTTARDAGNTQSETAEKGSVTAASAADPSVAAAIAALQSAFRDDLARVESRYQDEISRLQELHRTQVGLLLERVDAAEIRAESLQDVVDKLSQTVPQIEAFAAHSPEALAEVVAARVSEILPDAEAFQAAQAQLQTLLARFGEQLETQQARLGTSEKLEDQLQRLLDRLGSRGQAASASRGELGEIDRRIATLTDRLNESLAEDHRRGPQAADVIQRLEAALASVSERLFAQDTQMSDFSALVNRLERLGGSLDEATRMRQSDVGTPAPAAVAPEVVAPIKESVDQILAKLAEQQTRLDQAQNLGETLTSLVEDVRSQRVVYETANQNVETLARDLQALKEEMGGRLADQKDALAAVQSLKDQYQGLTETLTKKPEGPETTESKEPGQGSPESATPAAGSAFPMMFPPFWFMLGR